MCAQQAALSSLPTELLVEITTHLGITDNVHLCSISRHLQNVLRDHTYRAYFRALPPPSIFITTKSPLRWASEQVLRGDHNLALRVAERCLALGAHPDTQAFAALPKLFDADSDRMTGTCLHAAVCHENFELVRLLLEHGGNPMLRDKLRMTVLYRAVEHLRIDSGECSAMFMAIAAAHSRGKEVAFAKDRSNTDDPVQPLNITSSQRSPSLTALLNEPVIHNLMLYSYRHLSRLQVLIDLGAPVDARNKAGRTVLSGIPDLWSPPYTDEGGWRGKAAAFLIERGADIEALDLDVDGGINKPLSLAVLNNCHDMIRLLVREGAELAAPCDENGETMAMFCARRGYVNNLESLKLILTVDRKKDEGKDVVAIRKKRAAELLSATNPGNGMTAMGYAVAFNRPRSVQMLLAHGAVLEVPSDAPPREDRAAMVAAFRQVMDYGNSGPAAVLLHILEEQQDEQPGRWFGGNLDLKYTNSMEALCRSEEDLNMASMEFFLGRDEQRCRRAYES